MLLCLLREIADLQIDLLQRFQCPQLVTRHVSSLAPNPPRFASGGKLVHLRAAVGNDFAPYGIVGAAFSYVVPTGTAFEAGLGAGFPGLQLGGGIRQLFATGGGFNIALELGIAGNTKQQRASNVVVTGADTS